jgi:hypothetical protein
MQQVEIRVRGHIDEHWSAWFDDLEITTHTDQDETLLRGLVADQSAVYGLMARLRDLGLALVSMTISETDNQEEKTS